MNTMNTMHATNSTDPSQAPMQVILLQQNNLAVQLKKQVKAWRKDADQYQAQVDEAHSKGSPYDQMLATAGTLKDCAKDLEKVCQKHLCGF